MNVDKNKQKKVKEVLRMGELQTAQGLNQELGLLRLTDALWGLVLNIYQHYYHV